MANVFNQRTVVGSIVDVYPPRTVGKDDLSVVNFTIAVTPSVRNADSNEWEDGETEFLRATAWRRLADNIVASFNKGDRIIAIGRQTMDAPREGRDGETIEARPNLTVDYVGIDLTWDPAHSEREAKNKTTAQSEEGGEAPKKASNPSASKKSAPKKSAPKKETKGDDIFGDDDDIFGDDDDIFGDD